MAVAILLNVSDKRMKIVITLPTQPLQKELMVDLAEGSGISNGLRVKGA